MINWKIFVEDEFPGLVEEIKNRIEISEFEYDGIKGSSTLWEHTISVASVSMVISTTEKTDPVPVLLTALFHDSGKFVKGKYHADDIPEEQVSIKIANEVMTRFDIKSDISNKVSNALNSLYMEGTTNNLITDIIHDSDFLSKSGPSGIPVYFSKGVLRRKPLIEWLLDTAGKEITYNYHLETNMRTRKGRDIAKANSRFTQAFFKSLFSDLKAKGIADFKIISEIVKTSKYPDGIELKLALPKLCPDCLSPFEMSNKLENGIKCEKIITITGCKKCSFSKEIFFCIPEINRK